VRLTRRTVTKEGEWAKAVEQTYQVSPQCLYDASLKAIAERGWSVRNTDRASLVVSFNTGLSWRSWSGQDITVSIFGGQASAKAVLTGGLAKKGTVFTGGQMVGWGEKKKVIQRFLQALGEVLPNTPEPQPNAPVSTSDSDPAAELEKLAELHDQGVLSDDEFAAAKARTLG
jgi:hypothetical protein